MDRRAAFLWGMQNVLEHLGRAYDQWQDAEGSAAQYWAENMRRDVNELARLLTAVPLAAGVAQPTAAWADARLRSRRAGQPSAVGGPSTAATVDGVDRLDHASLADDGRDQTRPA